MWSRLGASSPAGGASRRLRMSSWIIASGRSCGGFAQVSAPEARCAWAARTIFGPVQAHLLDSRGSRPKNGFRVPRRLAALLLALAAFGPPAASARPAQTSLQERLARALRVPHVAPARSAAIALDLPAS